MDVVTYALCNGKISKATAAVASEYSTSSTYNIGDIVWHDKLLYVAICDNITGTWDSSKWEVTTIADEIAECTSPNIYKFI